jgi:hypothetical protein
MHSIGKKDLLSLLRVCAYAHDGLVLLFAPFAFGSVALLIS